MLAAHNIEMHDQNVEKRGIQKGIHETALRMLRKGVSVEQVQDFTGLSIDEIEEL